MSYNVRHTPPDGVPRLCLSTLSEERADARFDELEQQLLAGDIDGGVTLDQDGLVLRSVTQRYLRNSLPAFAADRAA